MLTFLCVLLFLALALHSYREYWRRQDLPQIHSAEFDGEMMRPTATLKTQICLSIFSVSRSYATCVKNVQSIVAWQRHMGFDVYSKFPDLTVVIGERDSSLDRRSMVASAKQGQTLNSGIAILETEGTNHFISLEQPDTIRRLHRLSKEHKI